MSTSSLVLFGLKVKPTPNRVPWKKLGKRVLKTELLSIQMFPEKVLDALIHGPQRLPFKVLGPTWGKQRNIIVDRV
jgi:hypothetical protein